MKKEYEVRNPLANPYLHDLPKNQRMKMDAEYKSNSQKFKKQITSKPRKK